MNSSAVSRMLARQQKMLAALGKRNTASSVKFAEALTKVSVALEKVVSSVTGAPTPKVKVKVKAKVQKAEKPTKILKAKVKVVKAKTVAVEAPKKKSKRVVEAVPTKKSKKTSHGDKMKAVAETRPLHKKSGLHKATASPMKLKKKGLPVAAR